MLNIINNNIVRSTKHGIEILGDDAIVGEDPIKYLGLDDVMFIYINRDNTDMKSYMFHVTDDMKQDFVGRIDYVDNYVKQMKVPPKPTDVPRKSCEYCNYKSLGQI